MALKGFFVAQQMRERELILELLKEESEGADCLALWYALSNLGIPIERAHYDQHLSYLENKGYIGKEYRTFGRVKICLAKITARGIDLLSGLITDPGVGCGSACEV